MRFSPEQRGIVKRLASIGLPHTHIAKALGITKPTLYKHLQAELDEGASAAHQLIAGTLFEIMRKGQGRERVTAAIFLAKTQLGWTERHVVEHNGGPAPLEVRITLAEATELARGED